MPITVSCVQIITLLDVTGPVITLDPPLPHNIFDCIANTDTTLAALGRAYPRQQWMPCGGDVDIVISYTDEVTTSCTGDDDTPEGSGTLEADLLCHCHRLWWEYQHG